MQKIYPHLWYDKEAKEAAKLYTSFFPNAEIYNVNTITNTPSGDVDIVSFKLAGQDFQAISAGPYFKFNPAISLFSIFESEKEIDEAWKKLSDGGNILMPFDKYPWAEKYGWVSDKYGLSWQLSWTNGAKDYGANIIPALMFTGKNAGKSREAMEKYIKVFPNSKIKLTSKYEAGDGDEEGIRNGYLKHAQFELNRYNFIAMDSTYNHGFDFNEAISFVVSCDTQEEIDYYWKELSRVPESEQCGWCKDEYGVSWQIVPKRLDEMMASGDRVMVDRVTQAFLQMKKFDIAELERVARG